MPVKSPFRFEKLSVPQSARRLSAEVYSATQAFPKEEMFGLTSQRRRSAVSMAANMAEGGGRNSDRAFAHFLERACGSAMEMASLLYVATDVNRLSVATRDVLLALAAETAAQISGLRRSLQGTHTKTPFPRGQVA